jgi:uncharacterized protein YndB with AHSA1/START domain
MSALRPILVVTCIVAWGAVRPAIAADDPAAKPGAEKVMASLSQLIGGTWVNTDPRFVIENRYEWSFGATVIRGFATIGKGSPHAQESEALIGQDPTTKTVWYVDCHGGNEIFKGTVTQEKEDLVFEFATIVGKAAKWREVLNFTDKDTMQFTIFSEQKSKWIPIVKQTSKRQKADARPDQVVTEGIIDAPVAAVWAALATNEGQESWNVAHADIDLKVGGLMRTHYDRNGKIGDPQTIENTILCFEPNRMLAIQVKNPPANFPFKNAIQKIWTVLQFEEAGPSRTKLRIAGNGYGDDEESRKLRDFFEKGNDYTLKKLQAKFAKRVP